MAQPFSKRNHLVPESYLKMFRDPASEREVVWVYDKDGSEPRAQTPRDTAVEQHLYTVDLRDGTRSDELEREVFGRLDSHAAPILRSWAQGAELEPQDVAEIATCLAFLHCRVRRTIEAIKDAMRERAIWITQRAAEDEKFLRWFFERHQSAEPTLGGMSFDELRSSFQEPEKRMKYLPDEKVALGLSLSVAKDIAAHLRSMNWCLCVAPEGADFITADAPLVVFWPQGHLATFGAGFVWRDTEVSLPISPRVCLLLDRTRTQRRRSVGRDFVYRMNRRAAHNAERFVIASRRSKAIVRLVRREARTRVSPKIDRQAIRHYLDLTLGADLQRMFRRDAP